MDRYTNRGRELMKNIKDTTARELPVFDRRALLMLLTQMKNLYQENSRDTSMTLSTMNAAAGADQDGGRSLVPAIHFRHAILERDVRLALTYLYARLAKLRRSRWHYGATLPDFLHNNATEQEIQYFHNYSRLLSNYMRSIGKSGLDLTVDWKPAKTLMVQVEVLQDWELTMDDGGRCIKMVAGTVHLIPSKYYEHLFQLGIVRVHKVKVPERCNKY